MLRWVVLPSYSCPADMGTPIDTQLKPASRNVVGRCVNRDRWSLNAAGHRGFRDRSPEVRGDGTCNRGGRNRQCGDPPGALPVRNRPAVGRYDGSAATRGARTDRAPPGLADNPAVFTGLRRALEDCGAGQGRVLRLQPAAAGRACRGLRPRRARRAAVRGHRGRTGKLRRAQPRWADRAIPRAAPRRTHPGGCGGDGSDPARRDARGAWLLSPLPLVRQLRPGSALLAELASPAPGCSTRFVTFSSAADTMILPPRYARLQHPDLTVSNIVVPGAGHLTPPTSARGGRDLRTTRPGRNHPARQEPAPAVATLRLTTPPAARGISPSSAARR